jgi:hypothetical protein
MIKQTKNQTLEVGLAHDLSQVWWQFEDNFGMMLENECSYMFFQMFSSK